ncbi:hypothetical protein [Streptomyces sp. NPDC127119]|uniref:hypothetical protein n=1 Tax=Streptomyces sp. NPDC127119 TaxID=3345370 RepID=UPI00362E3C11
MSSIPVAGDVGRTGGPAEVSKACVTSGALPGVSSARASSSNRRSVAVSRTWCWSRCSAQEETR